ncbi:hypothetical protein JL722_13408 [Aureococcus anophagefferens]|nr:hypothetical protein JL722_13408 [Aureococcus anophagefferens]
MSDYYIIVIVYILIDDVWYVFYIFVCIYYWGDWVRRAREANVKFIILSALNVGPLAYMPVIDEALGVTAPDEIVKEAAEDGYEAPGVVFGGICEMETAVLLKAVGAAKAWMREASTRSSWYQHLLAATHEANAGRGAPGGDAVGRNFFDETQMEVLQEKIKDDFAVRAVAATRGPMSMRTMVLKVETKVQFGKNASSNLNPPHAQVVKEREKECDALAIANIDGGLAIIYIVAAAMLSWAVEIGLWHCCKANKFGERPVDGGFEILDSSPVNGQDYGDPGCRVVSVKKVLEVRRTKRVRDGEAAPKQPKTAYELWYKKLDPRRGRQSFRWRTSLSFEGLAKKISCINIAQLDALLECPFVPRGTIVKLEGLAGATFDVASAVRGVVTAANAASRTMDLRLTQPTALFTVSADARSEKRVAHAEGVRTFVNMRSLNASSASASELKHSAAIKFKGRMIPVTISLSNSFTAVSRVDSTFKEPLLFAHSAALVVLFPLADDDMVYLVLGLCASQEVREWLRTATALTHFIRAAALDPDEMPDDLWQRHCSKCVDGALDLPPMVVQEAVAGGFCKGPGVYEKLAPHLAAYAAAMDGLSAASEAAAGDLDGVRGDARARTAGAAKARSIARNLALDFAPEAVVKAAPACLDLAAIEKMTQKKLRAACKKAKLSGC